MTSEEIKKAITEKSLSKITIEDRKLTEEEKSIWINGFYEGCLKGMEYATALIDEKFNMTLTYKGKGNDK